MLTNHAVFNRVDLRERTKTMSSHGDRRRQIADFRDSFERINWLYLLFKCGIKTKKHFEWLLWHWSSLGQLNLEHTWPRGLQSANWPVEDQCQRSHAHGFIIEVYCQEGPWPQLAEVVASDSKPGTPFWDQTSMLEQQLSCSVTGT